MGGRPQPFRRAGPLVALAAGSLLLILAACAGRRGGGAGSTGPTPGAEASGSQATAPFPCTGWPQASAAVFERAGLDAGRFGSVAPGDPVAVVGRSAQGWWAIAPGTAQAANVGPFRWRWLPPDTRLRLEGTCSDLPRVTSPPAGVCFEMAMGAVPLRAGPSPTSAVVATLPAGGYVAVTGAAAGGWLQVDAGSGSAPGAGTAFVAPRDVDVNGPCDHFLRQAP